MARSKKTQLIKIAGVEGIVRTLPLETWQQQISLQTKEDFLSEKELRVKDITWRLAEREEFKNFLKWLLIIQNVAVFGLVIIALLVDKAVMLQPLFTTLVGGTLLETTSMIYIIIRWLFTDIRWNEKDKTKSKK